jgi:hypothetical protein
MLQFGVFDLNLGQIMAYFTDPWVVGWVLVGSGILGAAWLLENITDPIPVLGWIFDFLVKIGTFLGFFVGIVDILVGYVVWATQPGGIVVAAVLILAGFALVMRVLSKFPLAFLFAGGIAIFATFTIYGALAPMVTTPIVGEYIQQVLSLKWMVVIAVIIFCVIYVLGGLIIKIVELIGKVFAATPVLVLIGLGALALGIVMLLINANIVDPGLLGLTLPWPAPPFYTPP